MKRTKVRAAAAIPQDGSDSSQKDADAKLDEALERMRAHLEAHDGTSLEIALDVGGRLLAKKAEFKQKKKDGSRGKRKTGAWGHWLEAKAKAYGQHPRTLQRFMRVAKLKKNGFLAGISTLHGAYAEMDGLRPLVFGDPRRQAPTGELTIHRVRINEVQKKVSDLVNGRNSISAVEINAMGKKRLRVAVARALREKGDVFLKRGGILLIRPNFLEDSQPVDKPAEAPEEP